MSLSPVESSLPQAPESVRHASTPLVWTLGVLTFVTAFLRFAMQPLVVKALTPAFGGAAGTWLISLLFFQVMLLAGYALATTLSQLPMRWQGIGFGLLAIGALLLGHIRPEAPTHLASVETDILRALAGSVAVPCLFLFAASTMLQEWYFRCLGRDPYPLFSLSNIGCLGALLGYPLLIEPSAGLDQTFTWWIGLYWACTVVTIVLSAWIVRAFWRGETKAAAAAPALAPGWADHAWWVFLSGIGSFLLIGVTQLVTLDVAPVPLIALMPLVLFLLTFIIVFAHNSRLSRYITLPVFFVTALLFVLAGRSDGLVGLFAPLPMLFGACLFAHHELASRRPSPVYLARYYLVIAIGGAVGGALANFVAPLVYRDFSECYVAVAVLGLVAIALVARTPAEMMPNSGARWSAKGIIIALLLGVAIGAMNQGFTGGQYLVATRRNFYGVLNVREYPGTGKWRALQHGTTLHGEQFTDEKMADQPTTYFGWNSPIGMYFRTRAAGRPLRVGIIGLGAGTVATYGARGDAFRFYEINPAVIDLAQTEFTFIRDSKAAIEIVPGDARLTLEGEEPQKFDLLFIDAFNSDSIPLHLLTREAFDLYARHLAPDGIILAHVSTNFLDLNPVLAAAAARRGWTAYRIFSEGQENAATLPALYVVLIPPGAALGQAQKLSEKKPVPLTPAPDFREWTDDYNTIIGVLRSG